MPRPLVFLILALPLVGAYGLYAVGIVSIYRASRVLNLAHGGLATVPAFLVYSMVKAGVPMPVAFIVGVASGAALGLAVERIFVRRLRSISTTAQTVGTVAALGILISLSAKIWGTGGLTAPAVFPEGHLNVGSSILRYGQLGLFGVAVGVTILLYLALDRTWFGLAMRGAAVNRRGAALAGINPNSTTAAAWALGGAMAALAGILLASVTTLHPYTLSLSVLPAFVAALIAGLERLPAALGGAAIVGVVIGFVPVLADLPVFRVVIGQLGGAEFTLAVTAMIVMALRGGRLVGSDVRGDPAEGGMRAAGATPRPARRIPLLLAVPAGILLVAWVFIPMDSGLRFSLLGDANQALLFTLATVSLVLLVGWVGQISLAQAAFVGVGAYATTFAIRRGVPFPFTLPVAAAVSAAVAALLGMVALRVRGLYLAVATLIFAWMADYYLFSAPWLVGSGGSISIQVDPIGPKGGFPYFDFTDRRSFYFLALAAATLAVIGCANLRRSKSGRAFFAIRGSEVAAASLGIDVTRYKLLAFGLSGAIAGLAGSLIATHQQTIVPAQFAFTFSLFYLSVAVVGGLQSLGGAVAASMVFAGLNQLFFRVDALRGWLDVVSAGLLAGVLLFYPGGLAAVPRSLGKLGAALARLQARVPRAGPAPRRLRWAGSQVRALATEFRGMATEMRRFAGTLRRRAPLVYAGIGAVGGEIRAVGADVRRFAWRLRGRPQPQPVGAVSDEPLIVMPDASPRMNAAARTGDPVLSAADITVRFGGLTAVDDASLAVHPGEIVGLIGPNGAGKTTFFNAMAGFVIPTEGRVSLFGADVTSMPVHERAARGMGRTFQVIQLFGEMTVRENLTVATHLKNPSGLLSHLVVSRHSVRAERRAAATVTRAATLLGIEDVLDRRVSGLPFGTLRLVELARALVTEAPVVMLDEPASGLDSSETERFGEVLKLIRDRLGLSLVVIEHDVGLVMSVCNYVYVLDRGRLIAEGRPDEVRRDPQVIGAYLGTPAEVAV